MNSWAKDLFVYYACQKKKYAAVTKLKTIKTFIANPRRHIDLPNGAVELISKLYECMEQSIVDEAYFQHFFMGLRSFRLNSLANAVTNRSCSCGHSPINRLPQQLQNFRVTMHQANTDR
eukprot:SAG25_NODE_220_length_11624_cov_41.246508_2_plen_119_part_00